jgi:hypothetical protein
VGKESQHHTIFCFIRIIIHLISLSNSAKCNFFSQQLQKASKTEESGTYIIMGLTKKSKKDKKAAKDAPEDAPAEETPALSRPGTSGTELGLRESHQQARSAFQRAQRAEQTYRIRKQATAARTDKEAAVSHVKNAMQELRKSMRSGMRCLKLMPAVAKEKNQARQQKTELKQMELQCFFARYSSPEELPFRCIP